MVIFSAAKVEGIADKLPHFSSNMRAPIFQGRLFKDFIVALGNYAIRPAKAGRS